MTRAKPARMEGRRRDEKDGCTAVFITDNREDYDRLETFFAGRRWRLRFVEDWCEARIYLRGRDVPIVFVDAESSHSSWREVLSDLARSFDGGAKPQLVVVSRLANEGLWAEVLNLGGFDLLPKPLYPEEVQWLVRDVLFSRTESLVPCGVAEAAA